MVPMPKSAAMVATVLAAGLVGTVATTRGVQAEDGCRRVYGHMMSTFTTANCTSPVGLCAAGTITHGGILESAATFLAFDAAPSAGMPTVEPAANVSYSGQLTIDTKRGTLVVHDLGVIDGVHSNFTELERPASGTGRFAHATNVFFISGSLLNNGTEFDGEISGELCNIGVEPGDD